MSDHMKTTFKWSKNSNSESSLLAQDPSLNICICNIFDLHNSRLFPAAHVARIPIESRSKLPRGQFSLTIEQHRREYNKCLFHKNTNSN